jgi:pimeloyl-ACP methyl ester carboxylesterase
MVQLGPPFPVGVTRLTYTDAHRSLGRPGDAAFSPGRQLDVTIRYPARTEPGDPSENTDAPFGSPGPLVVFAHGFGASADTYATMEHQLAASGFVVAAPDFPLTSATTSNTLDRNDITNEPGDLSFLITQLLNPTTAPNLLRGAIEDTKVGVIGHSDGGVAAAAVAFNSCCADPRIGAAAILSGAETAFPDPWFTSTPPLLAVHGTADEVNPFDSSVQLVQDDPGTKTLVDVPGGSHLGPFTTDPTEPAVVTVVADFLHATLQNDPTATAQLPTDITTVEASP